MSKKHTLEFIKNEYTKKGFEFLDNEYNGNKFLHNIKCLKCNHIWKQKYNALQIGRKCPKCYNKRRGNTLKLNLEFVKEEYSKKNFIYLDNYYNNHSEKHNIKCLKCNRVWKQRYNDLYRGKGCPNCAGLTKYTLEFIKEEYQKKGYEFLDKKYVNSGYKHNIKCLKCNHIWKQKYNTLQQGYGCFKCSREKAKQTCLKRYNVINPTQNKEIALKAARSSNNYSIHYHWLTGEELVCVGSYEEQVVYYLNNLRINYLWQPKVFTLSTGKTYRPDFYLVDQNLWVEIKGWMRKDALEKWNEFHSIIHPNSELWDKAKLKEMRIL